MSHPIETDCLKLRRSDIHPTPVTLIYTMARDVRHAWSFMREIDLARKVHGLGLVCDNAQRYDCASGAGVTVSRSGLTRGNRARVM